MFFSSYSCHSVKYTRSVRKKLFLQNSTEEVYLLLMLMSYLFIGPQLIKAQSARTASLCSFLCLVRVLKVYVNCRLEL